jgi:osmotically-inducible protein OsmY
MRSDREIKEAVEERLRSDRNIDATDVAVAVKDGVVMLVGFVRSYSQQLQAEGDAKHVADVVGVANDVEVRLPAVNTRPDPGIAREVVSVVQKELRYSSANIKVVVKDRWVTLEGMLDWTYQRRRAELAVRRIRSVRGVTNLIKVRSPIPPAQIKRRVEVALGRDSATEAAQSAADDNDAALTPRGSVRSWADRKDTQGLA